MLNSGDVFAGFTIERLLGQGGMGSVYLARHPRLGRLTALKLLNRELFADREVRARFEREADLVAQLEHPNIVAVYDRGSEDAQLWISMQYVDGVDAASVQVATLPPERAVQIIEGVADALDYAHTTGVLHRDVKPANIMLARSVGGHGERVFLADFGIARLREDSTHLTQAGMFTATLAYASPEQMTGAPLDHSTDQYSLACALYWLLTGIGPFDSAHPAEIIRGHLQLMPYPASMRRPGISTAMDAVINKAMAKRPIDRFTSCAEFAAAARRALKEPPALPVQSGPTYRYPPNHPAAQQPVPPGYAPPPPGYAVPPQPYPPQAYQAAPPAAQPGHAGQPRLQVPPGYAPQPGYPAPPTYAAPPQGYAPAPPAEPSPAGQPQSPSPAPQYAPAARPAPESQSAAANARSAESAAGSSSAPESSAHAGESRAPSPESAARSAGPAAHPPESADNDAVADDAESAAAVTEKMAYPAAQQRHPVGVTVPVTPGIATPERSGGASAAAQPDADADRAGDVSAPSSATTPVGYPVAPQQDPADATPSPAAGESTGGVLFSKKLGAHKGSPSPAAPEADAKAGPDEVRAPNVAAAADEESASNDKEAGPHPASAKADSAGPVEPGVGADKVDSASASTDSTAARDAAAATPGTATDLGDKRIPSAPAVAASESDSAAEESKSSNESRESNPERPEPESDMAAETGEPAPAGVHPSDSEAENATADSAEPGAESIAPKDLSPESESAPAGSGMPDSAPPIGEPAAPFGQSAAVPGPPTSYPGQGAPPMAPVPYGPPQYPPTPLPPHRTPPHRPLGDLQPGAVVALALGAAVLLTLLALLVLNAIDP